MNIENMTVKNRLSFDEHKTYTNLVASTYFDKNEENGDISYAPDNARMTLYLGFIKFCTSGIVFEENESYDSCLDNDALFDEFLDNEHKAMVYAVATDALDIAEFEKQKILTAASPVTHSMTAVLDEYKKLLEAQNHLNELESKKAEYELQTMSLMTPEETVELNRKMLEFNLEPDKIASLMTEKYLSNDAVIHNVREIIEARN